MQTARTDIVTPASASQPAPLEMSRGGDQALAMVESDGTNVTLVVYEMPGRVIFRKTYLARDFSSLRDVLRKAFRKAYIQTGKIPGRVAFALAGPADEERGIVQLTNPPSHWDPVFDLTRFMDETNCRGRLFNNMEVQAADAISTPRELLRVLRPGHTWRDGDLLVVGDRTGLGIGRARQGLTTKLEGGHIELAGHNEEEADYIAVTALLTGQPYPSAETLISGHHGFSNLINWLWTKDVRPDTTTQAMLDALCEETNPGPVITKRVKHDPFAQTIIRVMGGLYGTWLRMMMTEHQPTAGVHLVGKINLALAHVFADVRFPFLERVNADGPHHERVSTFEVAANRDRTLPDRGGWVLAQQV